MKVRRTICIGCLLATLGGVATDSACASTLLSGYGGPGQGNQATLGSALLNGPTGGGRGRGGSGSASSTGTASSAPGGGSEQAGSATGQGSASGSGTAAASGAPAAGRGRDGHATSGRKGKRNGSAVNAQTRQSSGRPAKALSPSGLYPASERIPAGESSDALGVSGSDLIYIVLAAAVLASAALLTRRLAGPENVRRGS